MTTPAVDLANLAAAGFVIHGESAGDSSGFTVAIAGDVNGDGFADVLIGARGGDGPGDARTDAGQTYVVFGRAGGFVSPIDLQAVAAGTGGFVIHGQDAGDAIGPTTITGGVTSSNVITGLSVSAAGDVNGDGLADLIIGAAAGDAAGNAKAEAGDTYVVFGRTTPFPTTGLDLASVAAGNGGFVIHGEAAGDLAGLSVASAGDINGDGFADMIIGAPGADADGARAESGKSYVVFGRATGLGAPIDLTAVAAGTGGFAIIGQDAADQSGFSVSSAGDINADGFDDLLIGAPLGDGPPTTTAPTGGRTSAGDTYVVLGRASGFGPTVNLANVAAGNGGFALFGPNGADLAGRAVSAAGDVNGDGIADFVIGARSADGPAQDGAPAGGRNNAGDSYVVFGQAGGFTSPINLANVAAGTGGFVIFGEETTDISGTSVASAGDVNGDGVDDLLIGAPNSDGTGNLKADAGDSYVVFGRRDGFGSTGVDLQAVAAGTGGFVLFGAGTEDSTGFSVAGGGDVNGDGYDDIVVGAPGGDGANNAKLNSGDSYVVFGRNFTNSVTREGGAAADSLAGTAGADAMVGGQGNDTLTGAGGADAISGGAGDDVIRISDLLFSRVDGGLGTDTLALDGTGLTLNLAQIRDLRLQEMEQVDLTGTGNNTLVVTALEVLNLSHASNTLRVLGNAGDAVQFGDTGWAAQGQSGGFNIFTKGAARLEVAAAVTTPVAGNAAPSGTDATLTLAEDGTRVLTAADFGFTDTDGHALAAVRIASLPGAGTLTLGGAAVTQGQVVSATAIAAGSLVFTPAPNANGTGYASFTFQVQDTGGTANGGVDLDPTPNAVTFNVTPVNDAPVVAQPIADQAAAEDAAFLFALPAGTFADVEAGAALTLTATLANGTPLPAWLSFNAATRTFSGTPAQADVGSLEIRVTASDGTASVSDTFTLVVANTNDAPVAGPALANREVAEDTTFTFTLPAGAFVDPDLPHGDTLTLTAQLADGSPLPDWLSFNAATGTFSGTPPLNANLTLQVRVTATDGSAASVTQGFVFAVTPVNDAPTVETLIGDQSTPEDTAFLFTVPAGAFADVEGDTLTLTASLANGANLLDWIQFDASSGTFSGTPPADFSGTVALRVTASDGKGGTAFQLFTLNVAGENDLPVVSGPVTVSATEDGGLFLANPLANATDADGDALSVVGLPVTLPPGVTWDAAEKRFALNANDPAYQSLGVGESTVVAVTYGVTDGEATVAGSVEWTVTGQNDAPLVGPNAVVRVAAAGGPVELALPAPTDVDGDTLTITVLSLPDPGRVVVTLADGTPIDVNQLLRPADLVGLRATPVQDGPEAGLLVYQVSDGTVTRTAYVAFAAGDAFDAVLGTDAGDTLTGTPQSDDIYGLEGNDRLVAVGDSDRLFGGSGDDTLVAAGTATDLNGAAGNDVFVVGAAAGASTRIIGFLEGDRIDLSGAEVLSLADLTLVNDTYSFAVFGGGAASFQVLGAVAPLTAADFIFFNPVPTPPVAVGDAVSVDEDGSTGNLLSLLLANDTDSFRDTFTITAVNTAGTKGTVAFDAVGGTLSYTATGWAQLAAGATATDSFTYTITDSTGLTSTATVSVTVTGVNDAPLVSGPVTATVREDGAASTLSARANASDAEGTPLTVVGVPGTLPAGVTYNAATQSFTLNPANAAYQHLGVGESTVVTVQYGVSDGDATTAASVSWTVTGANDRPVRIGLIPDLIATEDTPWTYTVPAGIFTDPDGDTLTYLARLTSGAALPTWLQFDTTTGTFSGTPPAEFNGFLSIRVTARDALNSQATDTFTLVVAMENDAPEVGPGAVTSGQTAVRGQPFTLALPTNAFTDADGDVLEFSATLADGSELPAWLVFDPATRTFTGTPGPDDLSSVTVRVTGTDPDDASASFTFALNVANVNTPPVLATPLPDRAATEDQAFQFTVPAGTFLDAGDTVTLTATLANGAALPGWLAFNPTTGTFSGTPLNAHVGTVEVRVTATDSGGGTVSDVFAISVANTNDAPFVAAPLIDLPAPEDALFTFTIPAGSFVDPDPGDALTLAVTLANGAALPSWLSYNAATRTLSGTPLQEHVGTLDLRVTATDLAGTTASDVFAITVLNTNDAPVVSGPVTGTATEDGAAVSLLALANASDPDGTVLNVTGIPATLPAGVTYNAATRSFTLDPANAAYQSLRAGQGTTVTVSYGVSDGTVSTAASAQWTVTGTNDAPTAVGLSATTVAENGPANQVIGTLSATDPDLGDTFTFTLSGADAAAFEVVGTQLRLRTTADFETKPGYAITVTATDAGGLTRAQAFTIQVTDVAEGGGGLRLTGTSASEALAGGVGNDTIIGGGGTDTLTGGDGNDVITYQLGSVINGGAGHDTVVIAGGLAGRVTLLFGSTDQDSGTSTMSGFEDVDASASTVSVVVRGGGAVTGNLFLGSALADTLDGGSGGDTLIGGGGADSLVGGAGNDFVRYQGSNSVINGGSDIDTLLVTQGGAFSLAASNHDLSLASRVSSFEAIDASGSTAAARLTGRTASDTLVGGAGADTITGGGGADVVTGGAAADRFVYSVLGNNGTVTDFAAGTDILDLAAVDANGALAGEGVFAWIGTGAFTNVAGQLRMVQQGGNTVLQGDTTGDSVADLTITLTGLVALSVPRDIVL